MANREQEALRRVWAAFGCAPNPDDFRESQRDLMWATVEDMAKEHRDNSGRLVRENAALRDELSRLKSGDSGKRSESEHL